MSRVAAAAACGALLASPLTSLRRANAYPVPGLTSCYDAVDYGTFVGPEWDDVAADGNSLEELAREAFERWNNVLDENGNIAAPVNRGGGVDFDFDWVSGLGGFLATTDCDDRIIRFDLADLGELLRNPRHFRGVARHEMGHALRFHHTGGLDSFADDLVPTMRAAAPYEEVNLSNDDRGQVAARHSPEINAYNANPGFEDGGQDWQVATPGGGNAAFSTVTSPVANGNRSGRFKTDSTANVLRSRIALADVTGPSESSRELDAGFFYRKSGSADLGNVYGFLYTRSVVYPLETDPDGGYTYRGRLDAYDMDQPDRSAPYHQRCSFKDPNPSTTWRDANLQTPEGGNFWIPYHPDLIYNYDVKLEITTTLKTSSGQDAYLYVDGARVRTTAGHP